MPRNVGQPRELQQRSEATISSGELAQLAQLFTVLADPAYAPTVRSVELPHVGGGLERNFVRLVAGDQVVVELTPRNLRRGRILRKA